MKAGTHWQKFTAEQTEVLKIIEKQNGHTHSAAVIAKKHPMMRPPYTKPMPIKRIKSKLYKIWRERTGGLDDIRIPNVAMPLEPIKTNGKKIVATMIEGEQLVITYEVRINLTNLNY